MNYLNFIDSLYTETIKKYKSKGIKKGRFFYYQQISFEKPEYFFETKIKALKLNKTTILLEEKESNIKIYFSDEDIKEIITILKNEQPYFYNNLISYKNNLLKAPCLQDFSINSKKFRINGFSLLEEYTYIKIKNKADINMNGNDLIALLNLIFEKERTSKDEHKLEKTLNLYFG